MTSLFGSGRIADLILVVLVLEGVALTIYRTRTGRGPPPRAVLPFLLSGAALTLALRGALVGASWPWIAAPLVGALAAHTVDLGLRWTVDDTGREG